MLISRISKKKERTKNITHHQRNERKGRTTKHLIIKREGKEKNDDIRCNNQYSHEYYY